MKKKHLSHCILFFSYLMVFGFNIANAQVKAPGKKPFMWALKDEGDREIEYFRKTKLKDMSIKAGLQNSLLNDEIFLGNFWDMIKHFDTEYGANFIYLNVYIGINPEKKIVLLFGPSKSEAESGVHKYYHLKEEGFDIDHPENSYLQVIDDKILWTTEFVNAMALNTIGIKQPYNQFPNNDDPHKVPSDTRSITYCAKDILELLKVRDYFSKGSDISKSVIASLGSYSLNGVPRGDDEGKYVNRIVLEFDFAKKDKSKFYLDSIPEFMAIKDQDDTKCSFKKNENKPLKGPKKLDNGQLCPTNCP